MFDDEYVYEFLSLRVLPLFSDCCCVCPPDYTREYSPIHLRGIVLGPYHHLDGFESLPVVGGVVLSCHVVPCSPEDAVPDSLVPLVIVLPIEVGGHAGIEPPAGAVVSATISGGIHIIVAVGCGEKLLVMVEVLVETDSISSCPTAMTHQFM